jgi:hypothetical protein
LRKLGVAVVSRRGLDHQNDKAQTYGMLARLATDPEQALDFIDKARSADVSAGHSSAPWDLEELTLRIQRGDGPAASRLLQHLQADHAHEPGVTRALMQILVQAGVINPDGSSAGGPEPAGLVVPGGSAGSESSGLWTPGSDAPKSKGSALWTPGME